MRGVLHGLAPRLCEASTSPPPAPGCLVSLNLPPWGFQRDLPATLPAWPRGCLASRGQVRSPSLQVGLLSLSKRAGHVSIMESVVQGAGNDV